MRTGLAEHFLQWSRTSKPFTGALLTALFEAAGFGEFPGQGRT
jgi:hypothetical protein